MCRFWDIVKPIFITEGKKSDMKKEGRSKRIWERKERKGKEYHLQSVG
jgi:hypothetical protein